MSTPSHVATGYLLANACMAWGYLPPDPSGTTTWIGILASVAPDFDILAIRKIHDHRVNSLLHYPLTWIVASVLSLFSARIIGIAWLVPYILLVLASVLIHFLMDTLGVNAGICWLAPFRIKEFSFFRIKYHHLKNIKEVPLYFLAYLKHPVMVLELLLCVGVLSKIIRR